MVRTLLLSLILGLVLIASCGRPGAIRGMMKIGLVAPFAGRHYAEGYNILFAVKLAIRQWNAKGGVAGYRIELVAHDDHNDAEMGAVQARKMVADPGVLGVVGHISNASALAAAPEYHKAELAMISIGATADKLPQKAYPEVFQLAAVDAFVAKEAAKYVSHRLGCGSVAVISESSPSTISLGQAFEEASAEVGMIVAHSEVLQTGPTEYGEVIKRIRLACPDLVFFSGSFVQGAALWAEMGEGANDMVFLGSPLCAYPDFIRIGGPEAEGVYYMSLAPSPGQLEGAAEFVESYRALSAAEAWPSAALAYDATNLLLSAAEQAIQNAGKPDRASVIEALACMGSFTGITGQIAFDDKGARVAPKIYIYRLTNLDYPGQLEYVGGGE